MFGRATYDIYSTAKDHWIVALLTNGEGYHNFHHRFPNDYRNGVRWYQWDPSKWLISILRVVRLAYDLKKVSKFRILEARLKADRQRVFDWIESHDERTRWDRLHSDLEECYKLLYQRLLAWEERSKEHRALFYDRIQERSEAIRSFTHIKMNLAKRRFQNEREQWQRLIRSNSSLAALV